MWDYNPYYNPEALGLTTVAEIDYSSGSYEFDTRVVWKHNETGVLYTMRDSGCSCPTPFEDYCKLELLDRVDISELQSEINRELKDSSWGYITPTEASDFLATVGAALLIDYI